MMDTAPNLRDYRLLILACSARKRPDGMVRTALYEAAHIMLTRATRFSALSRL